MTSRLFEVGGEAPLLPVLREPGGLAVGTPLTPDRGIAGAVYCREPT